MVYWGSAWTGDATPSSADIDSAVDEILAGPYTSALSQYREIGSGARFGSSVVAGSEPPSTFSDADVVHMLWSQISAKKLPEQDQASQVLYCVVMPPGAQFTNVDTIG